MPSASWLEQAVSSAMDSVLAYSMLALGAREWRRRLAGCWSSRLSSAASKKASSSAASSRQVPTSRGSALNESLVRQAWAAISAKAEGGAPPPLAGAAVGAAVVGGMLLGGILRQVR
jgi:hypothetical protein